MTTEDTRHAIEQARAELRELKDHLRVKLDLAKKDAQTAWREQIEPGMSALERKLDEAAVHVGDATERARLQAKLGLADVKTKWPALESAIVELASDVRKGASELSSGDLGAEVHKAASDIKARFLDLKARLFDKSDE